MWFFFFKLQKEYTEKEKEKYRKDKKRDNPPNRPKQGKKLKKATHHQEDIHHQDENP